MIKLSLFDQQLKTSAQLGEVPAIVFFEAFIDGKRMSPKLFGLNTVRQILSPFGNQLWNIDEILTTTHPGISVNGQLINVPSLVAFAAQQIFNGNTNFSQHPIEGIVLRNEKNGISLKIKDPLFSDGEELSDAHKKR